MNATIKPIVIASVLALAGCAETPVDTSPLEAQIAEAKSGDFGVCYTHIHAAAVALEKAEKTLAFIKTVDNIHTEATYPSAVADVTAAMEARVAADEACNARTAVLEAMMPGIKAQLADHEQRISDLEAMHELMQGVTFATNSAQLTPPAHHALDVVANMLLRSGATDVEVVGHASSPASDEYNMRLSKQRAWAVIRHLKARGVRANFNATWQGESDPVADNDTAAGRRANQRAVVLNVGQ